MAHGTGDVVVLIPGITGSVLERDGKEIWAPTPGAALRGVLSLGKSISQLRLAADDPGVDDLGDGVRATRVLPDLHILPGLDWKIDGYGRFKQELLTRFGCVEGRNYFELPYDWRRDNRVAARRLARSAHGWLRSWRAESGNDDAKLVIVGHSMGGVVARLYLELLDGWRDTRTLITFGTPYSGSVRALEFLANGFTKGWGPFTLDLGAMVRSFTSVYQLLPSYRCLEGPAGRWLNLDEADWTGTDIDAARLRSAVTLHRELRGAVDARLARGDAGYQVRPVIGDFQPTSWAARRVGTRIETLAARTQGEEGGDGTVPKVSASPHELLQGFGNAMFAAQRHASLQNDGPVLDHVGGLLQIVRGPRPPVFPAGDEPAVLEVGDCTVDEPLVVRATSRTPTTPLVVTLVPVSGGPSRAEQLTDDGDGRRSARIEGLAPGDYRVTVAAEGVHPVTDIASVVDLAEIEEAADAAG